MADGLTPYADGGSLGRLRQIIDNTYLKKADAPDVSALQEDLTSVQEALNKIKVMTPEQLNAAINKAITEYQAQAQAQGIDLTDTAFLNGGGVTILVSWILTFVAQEKEGLQTAEEVSAAIQEAIKGIPYPSDEVVAETIDFGRHQLKLTSGSKSETIEKGLSSIEFGRIKRFDLTMNITLAAGSYANNSIIGELHLPNGGRYIKYKVLEPNTFESFDIIEGGSLIASVTARAPGYNPSADISETTKTTVYLARLD